MRISISIVDTDVQLSEDYIQLEASPEMTLDDLKGVVEAEINIPPGAQNYIIKNQLVTQSSRTLAELGVNEADIVGLAITTKSPPAQQRGQAAGTQGRPRQGQQAGGPDPEMLRLQLLADARMLAELRSQDADLAGAVNDANRFRQLWDERARKMLAAQQEKEETLARLNADPFNIEAQQKIEEIIRQERVMENMQKAMEENPESFANVTMLYISVLVNNVPIKAFVDSGAQTTIMSPSAAEKCGIMRLIDRRFSGIARGVGTAQILGRVHSADIQIGQYSLASSFTVMEGKDVDLLLGLDMLKRHQMCIDLKENCLHIKDDRVTFLPENEIPKGFTEDTDKEAKIPGPAGTTIGTKTGTVEASSSTARPPATAATTPGSRINIHPPGSAGNINTLSSNPPSQPAQASSSTATTANPRTAYDAPAPVTEQSISQIVQMGFSREEAVMALEQANGNVDIALGLLL